MRKDSRTGFNQSNILIFKINVLHISMNIKYVSCLHINMNIKYVSCLDINERG